MQPWSRGGSSGWWLNLGFTEPPAFVDAASRLAHGQPAKSNTANKRQDWWYRRLLRRPFCPPPPPSHTGLHGAARAEGRGLRRGSRGCTVAPRGPVAPRTRTRPTIRPFLSGWGIWIVRDLDTLDVGSGGKGGPFGSCRGGRRRSWGGGHNSGCGSLSSCVRI